MSEEQPMRIEDLNWMDVEAYLKQEDRLMLVLGACEQHGYLSLLTDVKIPQALADAASKQTGVLVAPAVNFGVSPYFLTYPGTISLRVSTFVDLVEDLVRSVYGYGFRRLLILNGHGGNNPARARLVEVANQLPGLQLAWYAWWDSHTVEALAQKHQLKPTHASWMEAFSFTRVSELPPGEKLAPSFTGLLNAVETRQAYGDGVFGGTYQADEAVMQEMFQACLEDVLYLLRLKGPL
jgi:creatinine amidohydrolase